MGLRMNFMLETDRLLLRPWQENDVEDLYLYAKDSDVGIMADWSPHKSMEESLEIIRTVFSAPEIYAMELRKSGRVIGCIGLLLQEGHLKMENDEAELGYWVGKPYWGQGLVPEAARALISHAFVNLGKRKLWACRFANNRQSQRVLEKCGFMLHHSENTSDKTEKNILFYELRKENYDGKRTKE